MGASVFLICVVCAVSGAEPNAPTKDTPERQLLVWHAEWCGPCRRMAPVVRRLQQDGYPVLWLDYDKNRRAARAWGVTLLPCSILAVDGQEQARIVGYASYNRLKRLLQRGR